MLGTASDGKEALALIKKENPNLVFLDIEMPGMNGFDVVEKLNAVNCKVIIITAYSTFCMPSGHFAWESAISLKSLLIQIL